MESCLTGIQAPLADNIFSQNSNPINFLSSVGGSGNIIGMLEDQPFDRRSVGAFVAIQTLRWQYRPYCTFLGFLRVSNF